ncbi:MAG: PilT/PilU family type 4a pilus ATPase [Phycisphaerae bacterium]|jgi:twitching motility protein PilT|nr:PilT/PilU family type 4a pilus ATPase [Phycisphaerae bacterium]
MKIHTVIEAGRRHNASDIHLLVGLPPMFRIGGSITPAKGEGLTAEIIRSLVLECLTPAQAERLEREWQLCVSLVFGDFGRARITVYKRCGNVEMSIRMSEKRIRSRDELGLPSIVDDLARKPHGLIILTGPTGVGKTTTFHYMLDLINAERACKIITIEDPVEYVHAFKRSIVVQQEVLVDVHDFTSALRHVLRQDPDVIAVGEMRDPDTIYTALVAAETGHLVIATLHTPGAAEVVQRLVSAFPDGQQGEVRHMLSSSLQAVVAQQLLPRAASPGQCLCCEILIGTQAVRHHIRENSTHLLYSEIQAGKKHGMVTLDQSLLDLYQRGEITYESAVGLAKHADAIKKRASSAIAP